MTGGPWPWWIRIPWCSWAAMLVDERIRSGRYSLGDLRAVVGFLAVIREREAA